MRMKLDGNLVKVVDGKGNGFHIAKLELVESHHATLEQKRKLLETTFAQMTPALVDLLLGRPNEMAGLFDSDNL